MAWVSDAQMLHELDERYLYTNLPIQRFLARGNNDQFLIISSKGMGKTLLMRFKRKEIERDKAGLVLIPQNEMCDYVTLPSSPSDELLASMEDEMFWEDLWKLAITISALLYFPHDINKTELDAIRIDLDRTNLPADMIREILSALGGSPEVRRKPSAILDRLFQIGKSGIEKIRSSGISPIWTIFLTKVTSGCFIFIDSFDQELSKKFPDNLDIWCAAQCGLLRAAWEVSGKNSHTRVYCTIRQEAYASFNGTEKHNIKGNVLVIDYSPSDLREIFDRSIRHFTPASNVGEFLGMKEIYNGYLRTKEDVFEYIYRHTIGIPRWLIILGNELANLRREYGLITDKNKLQQQQRAVAGVVNRCSAELAEDYICSEMKMFFRGDDTRIFIDKLVAKLPATVLSLASIRRISENFVENERPTGRHPVCLLYNLGLIGCIENTPSSTGKTQAFRKPYKFDWKYDEILPSNPGAFYLVHPCLHHLIQNKNRAFNFYKIRVGNNIKWGKREEDVIHRDTLRLFISYAHADWHILDKILPIMERYFSERAILNDIWLDRWKMKGGAWIQDQILAGLVSSDYLILVISKTSVKSNAVALEWKHKFSEKISHGSDKVFPLIVDETDFNELPGFLAKVYSYRYDNDEEKIVQLVKDILFWQNGGRV